MPTSLLPCVKIAEKTIVAQGFWVILAVDHGKAWRVANRPEVVSGVVKPSTSRATGLSLTSAEISPPVE